MKEALSILRLKKGRRGTRRTHGRRALTPMRHRGNRHVAKTRSHSKVGNGLQLLQSTGACNRGEWKGENEGEHGGDKERKGIQDSGDKEQWKDAEKHETIDSKGNTENTELSIHPGSFQELRDLSECEDDAANEEYNETEPEEEEPPF